jgi:hypothetical protein
MPVGPTGNNAAIQSVAMVDLHSGDIHKKFEENFVDLRASGSTNLASASQCSLSLLETLGTRLPSLSSRPYSSSNNGEAEEAQVVMHGTLHDSDKDYAVIDTTIVAAYNEVFPHSGTPLVQGRCRH